MVDNHHLEKEIVLFQGKVASLELEKVGYVDKIAKLELGICKLKSDFGVSALNDVDLHTSVIGLTWQVQKIKGDMTWVFSEDISKVVYKVFIDLSFYDVSQAL